MSEVEELAAVRVPREAWDAACAAAEQPEPPRLSLLSPPGTLEGRWHDLVAAYLAAPIVFRFSSTYGDVLFEATLALGSGLNVCVLERHKVRPVADGTLQKVGRDPLLEVAVTTSHPWRLVRRVLPPLDELRAPAQRTQSASERPVALDEATRAQVAAVLAAEPTLTASDALARAGALPPVVAEAMQAEVAASWLLTVAGDEGTGVGIGTYLASPGHLYRGSAGADPVWSEVLPGDLAAEFEWQLLGALDVVTARAGGVR